MYDEKEQPPRELSNRGDHRAFRPDFMRVGVCIDGVDRRDITYYNVDLSEYAVVGKQNQLYAATTIEPYWRHAANRQERRLMERWFKKRSAGPLR